MPATDQPEQAPRQVSEEARRFLAGIGRQEPFLFRALIDAKDKKKNPKFGPQELTGSFADNAQQLRRLNDAGYGIFVQINVADGSGWKADNIVAATCLFADFDGVPLENVERLALPPHVVVETSPGKRHYYWRVDGLPINLHPLLQQQLIELFGSDKSVHDKPRIMRLPGFLHQKNPDAPFLARVVEVRDAAPYTLDEFDVALKAARKLHVPAKAESKKLPASITAPGDAKAGAAKASSDVRDTESMLRHLIGLNLLDLGDRSEWVRAGIAIKASHGDAGFPLWLQLSSEADGFDGDDDCAKEWRTFKDDRPPEKQLTVASFFAIAREHGWKRPPGSGGGGSGSTNDDAGAGEGGTSKGSKADPAITIVKQAQDAGDEHFVGTDDLTYVSYAAKRADGSSRSVTARLDSSGYRNLLALRFHEEAVNKVAPKEQLNAAVALMEARAHASGARHPVYLRYARHGGKVYVNLDPQDGRVVEIDDTSEGWRMVDAAPVRFVEGSRGALPVPARGGSLALFGKHFNVSADDLTRAIAFMLSPYQRVDTFPILIATGEPGAAKSNFGDKIMALTDPPKRSRKAARFGEASEERNMHVLAARASVLFMDNISHFSAEVADQLCRMSTGSASSYRKHNTMDEEQQFYVVRPIVVTCISTPSSRSDLLSRSMLVTVERAERRRTEQAVWREFDVDAGKMLGFLFLCVSTALRNEAAVEARVESGALELPRMADFAQWIEAAGAQLGLGPGDFAKLLRDEQAATQAEAAQRDPLVAGLVKYFARPGAQPIDASASALRDMLGALGGTGELPHANQVKDRLTRQKDGLRALGIGVEERRDSHSKMWKFAISCTAVPDAAGEMAAANAGLTPARGTPASPNGTPDQAGDEPPEEYPF
ncbi:PriCT-2 domain-containing protein [Sphingomonas sp. MG17]|uniref:PriCT-2 domain-containing protein n=1 Tax=Sphingomonas tagetis TaxID=2949092 RepID=A0A9X2HIV4_9SPHN|nr:PriCT-2 domain-containing protein [Sphingomonas tagetis]MCP3729726.1 PriCT-2 domain-containing protein [Sphingomonas tagetis]